MIFLALFSWAVSLGYGIRHKKYVPFLTFGVAFGTILNLRHWLVSHHNAFALVVGVYDVLSHFIVSENMTNMVPCETGNCTVWGEDVYTSHPSWSVRFFERFVNGPERRKKLLLVHNMGNAIAFVVLHIQFLQPGGQSSKWHKWLGRFSLCSLTVGLTSAVLMANEHGNVDEYGNHWSSWGFYEMASCCFVPAAVGLFKIRSGDTASHRRWMWRYAGAMWGSFWIFRVGLLLIDPLLRDREAVAWLLVTWGSAPVGIAVAELARRVVDQSRTAQQSVNKEKIQ